MTIEEHNTRLSPPCEVGMNESAPARTNIDHEKVASIKRFYDMNGYPTHRDLKRQLCQTRRLCRTWVNGELIKLGRHGK